IDTESITEKQLNSCNRKRADVLPIWEYIRESYNIKEFMQIDTPLEKVEKISFRYSLQDAEKSIKKVITRLIIHQNEPTMLFFLDVLQKARDEFELRKHMKNLHEKHHEKSTFEDELKTYSDDGLWNLDEKLSREIEETPLGTPLYSELIHQHNALTDEMFERDLIKIPF
ncbi:MAG: hypothetical protein Q8J85_05355, partial [Sulfuricurvum sp.]|nr:hypothetical protein [Sulfuricurvum sp.]